MAKVDFTSLKKSARTAVFRKYHAADFPDERPVSAIFDTRLQQLGIKKLQFIILNFM